MGSSLWAQDSDGTGGDPYLAPDRILSALLTPSPRPDAAFKALLAGKPADASSACATRGGETDSSGEPGMAPALIEAMAGRGLTLEEIASLLDQPLPDDPEGRQAMEAAWRRGRLVGLARIKDANYEAALKGGVTAQKQVLDLLREPPTERGGRAAGGVTVVRRMLEVTDDDA